MVDGTQKIKLKKNWLLNWAEKKLFDFSRRLGQPQVLDEIHILNENEIYQLKRIEKGAVTRAALAGAISGLGCSLFGISGYYYLEIDPDKTISWENFVKYWLLVGPVILFFTIIEFYYLYYDGLKSIAKIAHVAGLDLLQEQPYLTHLAEAALELPNSQDQFLGINPKKNPLNQSYSFHLLFISLRLLLPICY